MVIFLAVAICALPGCSNFSENVTEPGFNPSCEQLSLLPTELEAGETIFSADGRSVAMAIKAAGKVVVLHDSKKIGPYDAVRGLQYMDGSRKLAFFAKKGNKEVVVANGVEGESFDSISALQYMAKSPVVYTAQLAGKMQVVADNKKSPLFDLSTTTPIISFDGKQLAYVEYQADTRKSSLLVCASDLQRCHRENRYDAISEFRSDATRSRFAFIAVKAGKKTVVVVDFRQPGFNSKETGWYDDVASFNISANGKHLAFLASRGAESLLVKDGLEIPVARFDTSFELNVANGGKVIYGALTGNKVRCFVDGNQAGKIFDSVDSPIMSPDGEHSLFVARVGEQYFAVSDGQAGPGFDMVITPQFSPDSSRIVYRARDKGQRFVVVADLQGRTVREHPRYEAVWEVKFAPDGKTVGYGVKRGQQYRWQVEKL